MDTEACELWLNASKALVEVRSKADINLHPSHLDLSRKEVRSTRLVPK
jgi:hypothetical protein